MTDQDHRVACPVITRDDLPEAGVKANAFRILADTDSDFFLDFMAYDEETDTAIVVARIRMQRTSMEAMRDRLSNTVREKATGRMSPEGALFHLIGKPRG